jgi:hypothetical protein
MIIAGNSDALMEDIKIFLLFLLNKFCCCFFQASKKTILGFGARFVLVKKNPDAPYWIRLTKETGKHNHITFDWERYIDSDEEGEEGDKGLGKDWDPS